MNEPEVERLKTALKVIRTWAAYDRKYGYKAPVPKDVMKLCDKVLDK